MSTGLQFSTPRAQEFVDALLISRALRWIWQSTSNATFEMVVVIWIMELTTVPFDIFTMLLIAAFIHDRIVQLFRKLYYVGISIATSIVSSLMRILLTHMK
jgi:type III secretory pathway component EscU